MRKGKRSKNLIKTKPPLVTSLRTFHFILNQKQPTNLIRGGTSIRNCLRFFFKSTEIDLKQFKWIIAIPNDSEHSSGRETLTITQSAVLLSAIVINPRREVNTKGVQGGETKQQHNGTKGVMANKLRKKLLLNNWHYNVLGGVELFATYCEKLFVRSVFWVA